MLLRTQRHVVFEELDAKEDMHAALELYETNPPFFEWYMRHTPIRWSLPTYPSFQTRYPTTAALLASEMASLDGSDHVRGRLGHAHTGRVAIGDFDAADTELVNEYTGDGCEPSTTLEGPASAREEVVSTTGGGGSI